MSYGIYNNFTPCKWRLGGIQESLSVHLSVHLSLQICVRPITFFALTLAYCIWHMCLSTWDIVSHTFIIPIWRSLEKNYSFWHSFVLVPQFVLSFEIVIPYLAHMCIMSSNITLWKIHCTVSNHLKSIEEPLVKKSNKVRYLFNTCIY